MFMSAAERKAAQRDRGRMKGLVEVQVKVHADDAQKVRAFAAELCAEYSPKLDWWEGEPPTVGTLSDFSTRPTGPVITETVTRKRIVPGVYGAVGVDMDDDDDAPYIRIEQYMSRADLIAARDVFNQLIDAMEE